MDAAVDALRQEGNKLYEQKKYDLALAKYSEMIKLDPKNASGYR